MKGAGWRVGRASSRYGQQQPPSSSLSPAHFSGPVRKWRKKWVLFSAPSGTSAARKPRKNCSGAPGVLLCKWTPLSPPQQNLAGGTVEEEPPRRKFHYAPITTVGQRKAMEGVRKGNRNNNVNEDNTTRKEDKLPARVVVEQHQMEMEWNSAAIYGHAHAYRMLDVNETPGYQYYHQIAAAVEEEAVSKDNDYSNNNYEAEAGKDDKQAARLEQQQMVYCNHGMAVHINENLLGYYQVADEEICASLFHPVNNSLFHLGV